MSFERFGSSDVYIFEHVNGGIECCACFLARDDKEPFPNFATPREALDHLDRHTKAGDNIGEARIRIEQAYPNLDVVIEPYVMTPEEEARQEEFFRKMKEKYEEQHPPENFRDKANGE